MAKRSIKWSDSAKSDLKGILSFYRLRNGNSSYSLDLSKEVISSVNLLGKFPWIGKKLHAHKDIRALERGNFSIIYKITKNQIIVMVFWDNRRNPDDLKKMLS